MSDPTPTTDDYREAMARFASGVAVMTTAVDGEPHGMTANAVSSVSLEPLLLLVCVERGTKMAELVGRAGGFALSVLADGQRHLSEFFADPARPLGHAEFEEVEIAHDGAGGPVLAGCVAWFDCAAWRTYDGGDHLIVVGRVDALGLGGDDDALLYYAHGYRRVGGEAHAAT